MRPVGHHQPRTLKPTTNPLTAAAPRLCFGRSGAGLLRRAGSRSVSCANFGVPVRACGRSCDFVYGTIALFGAWFHTLRLPHDFVTSAGPVSLGWGLPPAWDCIPEQSDSGGRRRPIPRGGDRRDPNLRLPHGALTLRGTPFQGISKGWVIRVMMTREATIRSALRRSD
jgi:hypothetical protein